MSTACGMLGYEPDVFWRSTILEISNAYIGHCRYHGIGPFARERLDVDALKAEMGQIKRVFPDGKVSKRDKRELKRLGADGW